MARKFLTPIDLSKLELQNARIQNLASAPASPVAGQIYYNTANNTLYFYNGTSWVDTQDAPSNITYGTLASRPAAAGGNDQHLYYATDNGLTYISNGSTWTQLAAFGSGASTTVTISGSAGDGSSTSYARADHAHAGPGFGSPASLSFGGSAADGSATTVARSDHAHAMPAHDASAHSGIKVHDLGLATASFNMNSQKITNLATPTSDGDAATKEYVDAVAEGLHIHASCDAATTGTLASITGGLVTYSNGTNGLGATLTLDNPLTTLDGYTLQNGNRILVKDQATSAHNGIYTWATGGSVLTRASDFNSATEIAGGDFTFVTNGTLYNNTGWVQTEAVATVGTDSVTFQQFSGAGTYTAGDGLSLNGSAFSFNPTATGGLGASASGAAIKLKTNSGLGTDANGLSVGAGTGITVSGGNVSLTNTSVTVNGTAISLGGSGTITANTTNALTLGTGLTGTSFNGSSAVTAAIDTSVVARKYSVAVGDGSATSITVTHSLGTRDVVVSVRETAGTYAKVEPDIEMATTNTVTVSFATAPTSNQYTVTVIG